MKLSPRKLNAFLLFKLPAAYFTGVRTSYIDNTKCIVKVKHRWINQNPFKSMFWAVQGMAAELSTGALLVAKIEESSKKISSLVIKNEGAFFKKATGKILFECTQGIEIDAIIKKAIETGEGQTITLHSVGKNSEGEEVSSFSFEWSLKVKSK